MLQKLKHRFRLARGGSVLILVIVLLLLLAILGTAYLSASRGDREVSGQTVLNTQVDMHAKGIANMVAGTIINDLADPNGYVYGQSKFNAAVLPNVIYPSYLSASPPAAPNTYIPCRSSYVGNINAIFTSVPASQMLSVGDIVSDGGPQPPAAAAPPPAFAPVIQHYWEWINPVPSVYSAGTPLPTLPTVANNWWQLTNAPGIDSGMAQLWLADRIPGPPNISNTSPPPTSVYWPNITQQLLPGTGPVSILFNQPFESPDGTQIPTTGPNAWPINAPLTNMFPNFKALGGNGLIVPTLDYGTPTSPGSFIAADADGDGIADSLLFRIPGATFDNLTWYAAVRIIDNNSAINVNTAGSRDTQMATGGAPNRTYVSGGLDYWGLFPSNVGLMEMLFQPANINPLLRYRLNNITSNAAPFDEFIQTPGAAPNSVQRTDFNYISLDDEFAQVLARRLQNPGFVNQSVPSFRAQAIPYSDTAAMAYHFGLKNSTLATPPTLLENLLPQDVYNINIRSTPYTGAVGSAVSDWFNANFNGGYQFPVASGTSNSIRPYLVTRNPVGNYITPIYDPTSPGAGFSTSNQNIGFIASPSTGPLAVQGEPLCTAPLGLAGGAAADPLGFMMLPYGPFSYLNNGATVTGNHYRGQWSSSAVYGFNDIVLRNGYTYICQAYSLQGTLPGGGQAPAPVGPPYNSPPIAAVPYDPAVLVTAALATPTNPVGTLLNAQYWQLQPYSTHPVKANVNTATFRELFRAFWCVMSGNPVRSNSLGNVYAQPPSGGISVGEPLSPFGDIAQDTLAYDPNGISAGQPPANSAHMFRTVLRDPTVTAETSQPLAYMDPGNVAVLRAAIAAVNTMGLRDSTQTINSRTIALTAKVPVYGVTTVHARVYSGAPQPFITEVFANNWAGDGSQIARVPVSTTNTLGYVAIELYNPYNVAITMTNWQLGFVKRAQVGSTYPSLSFTGSPISLSYTIPSHGYILFENYGPTGNGDPTVNYRPMSANLLGAAPNTGQGAISLTGPSQVAWPVNVQDVPLPGLTQAITGGGTELVLLRPRRADGQFTSSVDPLNSFNEGTLTPNLTELVPVDSYDFTGFPAPVSSSPSASISWHYLRNKGLGQYFSQTFPGRYDGTVSPRFTATMAATALPSGSPPPAPAYTYTFTPAASFGIDAPIQPTYSLFRPIQVFNIGLGGPAPGTNLSHFPNPLYFAGATGVPFTVNSVAFPFGGFARNADMLDIPFIGSYRITVPNIRGQTDLNPTSFLELNSVTVDAQLADDGDETLVGAPAQNEDTIENIGRFTPLSDELIGAPALQYTGPDYYFWTRRLFDYLTVQNNTDDYLPNFSPNYNDNEVTPSPVANINQNYPLADPSISPPGTGSFGLPIAGALQFPTQVLNSDGSLTDQTSQHNVGVDGLININTASAQVLNMLPLVPALGNSPPNPATLNWQLANAIVNYRTTNGPFNSIFDLNKVPGFQTAEGTISLAAPDASGALLSPPPVGFPVGSTPAQGRSIAEDYQSDFAEVARLSNLITTRSDTYTVYIVIEGWQNARAPGQTVPLITTNPPMLKVIRRYAFIADRSAVNGSAGSLNLKTITVPND